MRHLARSALQQYVRWFPIDKGKNRIVSLLWQPLSFGNYQAHTTLRQADITLSCDLTKLLQRQLFFWGSYEEQNCQLWIKLASRASTIFDVGANVGLYSLLAARVSPHSSIHAFEPTPDIVALLNQNIRINGIGNIKVNSVGIADRSTKGFLRDCRGSDGTNEGMNFVLSRSTTPEAGDLGISLVSLDDYCNEHRIDHIDILKMDIEGGEFEALKGAANLLRSQAIGCIFIEFIEWAARRANHSTGELKRMLANAGYRICRLTSTGLVDVPADETPDGENIIACAVDFSPH